MNSVARKAEDELRALEDKIAKLRAKRDTKRAKLRDQERRLDNKRKILLGALLQQWMGSDPAIKVRVEHELPNFLTRNADRAAFGIEQRPLSDGQEQTDEEAPRR